MATIINKRDARIIANRRPAGINYLTLTARAIYLPKQLSAYIGISSNKYIHFINDCDYWAFFINDDKDGFKANCEKTGTFRIDDRALCRIFQESVNKPFGTRFIVQETRARKDGNVVYEIYTKDALEVKMDKDKAKMSLRKTVLQRLNKKQVV